MRLLSGAEHFQVDELPAYPACGSGEHLYVRVEKTGVDTEELAEALARALHRPMRDVGFAGRKDRAAVARQWLSVSGGDEAGLGALEARFGERVRVLEVTRHRNKLRLGHLRGNRFRLALGGDLDVELAALSGALERSARDGILNRFGAQRFGRRGANLALARAWGAGALERAVELAVDPGGEWRMGGALPSDFVPGPAGRIVGALRRGERDAAAALRAAGPRFARFVASAAQSAVFNAVLDARVAAGLLHTLREGDVARWSDGGQFRVRPEQLAELSERAAPGRLEALATGPLPGAETFAPAAAIDAEERRWSADAGIDWAWLERGGALESPGERRALLVPFLEPPALAREGDVVWLSCALPAGGYATELLAQLGVEVPERRA